MTDESSSIIGQKTATPQKRISNGLKSMSMCSIALINREMQIETTM